MKLPLPSRIPILYLIISVLIAVGVVPLYFYATKVVDMNRETLQRNEKLLQNTVTSSLAQEIAQREKDILSALANLTYSIQVTSGGNLGGDHVEAGQRPVAAVAALCHRPLARRGRFLSAPFVSPVRL